MKAEQANSLEIKQIQEESFFRGLAFRPLERDWFDTPVSPTAFYRIASTEDALFFEFKRDIKPEIRPDSQEAFTPELWRADCAELFIAREGEENYREFNFAPDGRWWAADFSGYRDLQAELPTLSIEVEGEISERSWGVRAKIPLGDLGITLKQARINVCALLGREPEQMACCAIPLESEEPDFHRLESLSTVIVLPR